MSAREKVLAVARRLFAAEGYEGTSTEKVLQESGVSRGALYHHFKNKEALFEAVLEKIEEELAASALELSSAATDPVAALRSAFASFLGRASEPEVRQIVLTDAHSVVGWKKWREIEARYGLGLMKEGLRRAAAAGRLDAEQVDMVAHVLLAALIEVAFLIAQAPGDAKEMERGKAMLDRLLDSFLGPAGGRGVQ